MPERVLTPAEATQYLSGKDLKNYRPLLGSGGAHTEAWIEIAPSMYISGEVPITRKCDYCPSRARVLWYTKEHTGQQFVRLFCDGEILASQPGMKNWLEDLRSA